MSKESTILLYFLIYAVYILVGIKLLNWFIDWLDGYDKTCFIENNYFWLHILGATFIMIVPLIIILK